MKAEREPEGVRVVAGLFYDRSRFGFAWAEFLWSLKQNAAFWKQALLYVDPLCARRVAPYRAAFGEVVVDHDMPDVVLAHRRWNCKGWWAKRAVDRFGRVLFCDFDIFVRKRPDAFLCGQLTRAPRFLDIEGYRKAKKAVGCGCVYYDETCDWDLFLDKLYNVWRCDERAWTDALAMDREKFLAGGYGLDPWIVDWTWLVKRPELRDKPYIIHGISAAADGRRVLRGVGYSEEELDFRNTPVQEAIYRMGNLKRRLLGGRANGGAK